MILAIETATPVCGSAVAGPDGVLAEAVIDSGLSHSSRLMELVSRVLKDASKSLKEMDAVAVSVGPGSFTGIRIGMGAAIGLATGAGIPAIGVPTLDALARAQPPFEGVICPFVDARRGEVYFSIYESAGGAAARAEDYLVLPPSAMVSKVIETLDSMQGEPRAVLAGPQRLLGDVGIEAARGRLSFASRGLSAPGPAFVAALGMELYGAEDPATSRTPQPIYVRRSDAELGQSRKK